MRFIVSSALLCLLVTACDERQYREYKNVEAIHADGAFVRGWFPDWMPDAAVDIHEHHDLDTNNQAISFRISGNAAFDWPTICTPSSRPTEPRLKTKRFPQRVHELDGVRNCRDYFIVQAPNGSIHMWTTAQ
jgi:hypothetical protein